MQRYRSGHNGADSKSVCGQPHVSSNLTVCAKDSLKDKSFKEFFLFIPRPNLLPLHLLNSSTFIYIIEIQSLIKNNFTFSEKKP